MLAGGLRHREQHYNAAGARSQATMLILAAIALVLPAAYRSAAGAGDTEVVRLTWISLVLLAVYAGNLVFSLGTHAASSPARTTRALQSTARLGAPGAPLVCSRPPLRRSPG